MTIRRVYECDYCDYKSNNAIECEIHEASHIGNGLSLEEYRRWEALKAIAANCSMKMCISKNSETESDFDNALKNLKDFEESHGICKENDFKRRDKK